MRILVAEDDTALAGSVRKGLEAEHYAVEVCSDGDQARAFATQFDGQKPSLPILILTARARVEDRELCLDVGADDHLLKPFFVFELSVRIRALLRRRRLPSQSVLRVEDLKLDWVERRVTRGGPAIEFVKVFALLEYLIPTPAGGLREPRSPHPSGILPFDSAPNLADVWVAEI